MADAEGLRRAGNAAYGRGEHRAAAALYTQAIQACKQQGLQEPALHLLLGNRAAAHLKAQDWAAALADADEALALQPRWAKAHYRRAAALEGLGDRPAATAAAAEALALEPSSREAAALLRHLQQLQQELQPADCGGWQAFNGSFLPPLLAGVPWEWVPPVDGIQENLLLLLHGLGDKPAPFAKLASRMALPQTAALALGGPEEVPFSDGGRSWYTVFEPDFSLIQGHLGERRRLDSLAAAVGALRQLLTTLEARCGCLRRRVHLLGFSQGGTVALEIARQCSAAGERLGSCVAVSAALLPEALGQLQQQRQAGESGAGQKDPTPVLITHGAADSTLPRKQVEDTVAVLQSMPGMEVTMHSVQGKAHGMVQGEGEMRELMAFWARHLSSRPADTGCGGPGEVVELAPGGASLKLVEQAQQAQQHR